jgi:acetylornithine/succinyldiaminopimelate/putrescine aminotransferase
LLHTSNLFGTIPGPEVASTLDKLIGDGVSIGGKVFFCNSGSEANECAIKLARKWAGPGRHTIVSALGSFHGRTYGALTATGQLGKHAGFEPMLPGFVHVEYDDVDAIERACAAAGVAAVMLESIQGESGVIVPSADYIANVAELCQEKGILLIMDEVQTGLGRTGRWFGFHSSGVRPDIVTVAKALGNGMPIGACWATADVADAFVPGDHGSTFGGQPLAASAALAVLSVMQEIDAPALAKKAGERLRDGLIGIPGVDSVRGDGLLIGIQLDSARAGEVAASALDAGLVLNAPRSDTLRLAPPFIVSDAEIDEALAILASVIPVATTAPDGGGI